MKKTRVMILIIFLLGILSTPTRVDNVFYEEENYLEFITEIEVKATAYTSRTCETDDSPFITSIGKRVQWGTVAASRDLLKSHLPYGTLIKINGYNNKIFIVEDTMHKRKINQIDIWHEKLSEALNFGVQNIKIQIINS